MWEALFWSVVWIGLALSFAVAVGFWFGMERSEEFLAGFLIEKALAVDNLFVFAVIFSSFAVDSIPAIFAVTNDPFIVYTSNIFAILGSRSLYFLLAGVMGMFHYLKVGLALVLAFVGVKMLLLDIYKISIEISLLVIITLLGGAILASLLWPWLRTEGLKPEIVEAA
jgi:predicted tellurium resistance membrane protein TerC